MTQYSYTDVTVTIDHITGALPAGTNLIGKVGIDQVTANANEIVIKSITAGPLPDTSGGDLASIESSAADIKTAIEILDNVVSGSEAQVDIVTLPAGHLGQQLAAGSLSVVPGTNIADATYIGDIKFGEALPAGTALLGKVGIDQTTPGTTNLVNVNGGASQTSDIKVTLDSEKVVIASIDGGDTNIGNVDIVTLPAGNLGQQLSAASLSVTPATNVADATYIGDVKFGESLPVGSAIVGQVGIDQTTDGTTNKVQARNATHDNFQANANLQVGDADVAAGNPVPVTTAGSMASTIGEQNVTLTVIDTEYSYSIPSNCKSVEFWSRNGYPVRFAFTTGKVATPTGVYFTLKSNCSYASPPSLNLSSKTVYFASDNAGDIVEILAWS